MNPHAMSPNEVLFWKLADGMIDAGQATRGTMMGFPCLRVEGRFFASVERGSGNLIVKLPEARVGELIDGGVGKPFAPAGRTFREWVLLDEPDEEGWKARLAEARAFVAAS